MAAPAHDKYFLKSLHDEIDLIDRKLAHLRDVDKHGTDAERKLQAGKLATRRETLVRTARQLAKDGIEFKPSDLPRSFRTPQNEIPAPPTPPSSDESVSPDLAAATPDSVAGPRGSRALSPFSGTVLDGQAALETYKRTRSRLGISRT